MNHSGMWAALHTHSVLFFPRIKRSKHILQLIIHVKFDHKKCLKWVSLGDELEWYHKLMWLRPVLTQRAVGHIRARRRWKMGESALRSSIIHAQRFHIVTFRPLSSGVTQHHWCSVFMELLTFYLLLSLNVTDLQEAHNTGAQSKMTLTYWMGKRLSCLHSHPRHSAPQLQMQLHSMQFFLVNLCGPVNTLLNFQTAFLV